jgi:hypothetical protein
VGGAPATRRAAGGAGWYVLRFDARLLRAEADLQRAVTTAGIGAPWCSAALSWTR